MTKISNRIIFILPGETAVVDVIENILKSNNLEESSEDAFDKEIQNKEPRALIIRDATLTMVEKKIPEDKVVELLQQHLETSKEIAGKIVREIKENLIPYANVINLETNKEAESKKEGSEYKKADFQKELLNKIKRNLPPSKPEITEPKPLVPYDKKPQITNVEKNAQKIKTEKQPIISGQQPTSAKASFSDKSLAGQVGETKEELKPQAPPKEIKPDTYREPIE